MNKVRSRKAKKHARICNNACIYGSKKSGMLAKNKKASKKNNANQHIPVAVVTMKTREQTSDFKNVQQ